MFGKPTGRGILKCIHINYIAAKFVFLRELDGFKLIYQTMFVKVVQILVSANEHQNVYYNIETAWLSCALISA